MFGTILRAVTIATHHRPTGTRRARARPAPRRAGRRRAGRHQRTAPRREGRRREGPRRRTKQHNECRRWRSAARHEGQQRPTHRPAPMPPTVELASDSPASTCPSSAASSTAAWKNPAGWMTTLTKRCCSAASQTSGRVVSVPGWPVIIASTDVKPSLRSNPFHAQGSERDSVLISTRVTLPAEARHAHR